MSYLTPHYRERASGLSLDLSSILGSNVANAALGPAADAVVAIPAVQVNRARIASLVQLGYKAADTYSVMKPGLFIAGVLGALASGAALAKRRKNPEAVTLYTLTCITSAAVAWFTRPAFLSGTPPAPTAANPNAPGVVQSALAWTDGRVTKLSLSSPGWEGKSLTRLMHDLGTGTMAPAITTLLTKNSR